MQKGLNRVRADPHAFRDFLVTESLQQQSNGLMLSMGKIEVLRDLGQRKGSRHASLQHKQGRGALGTFAIAVQRKQPAVIRPASGSQSYNGVRYDFVCRRVLSIDNRRSDLLVEKVSEALRRRPRIGQNCNRLPIGKDRFQRSVHYKKAQYRWRGYESSATTHGARRLRI